MSNVSIIEGLARRRVVEKICDGVTKRPGSPDSQDLAQHVYQILLEKTTDLHGIENIEAFVNTIVFKQWNLVGSEFYRRYRDYGIRAQDIDETRAVRAIQEGAEGLSSGLRISISHFEHAVSIIVKTSTRQIIFFIAFSPFF